MNFTKTVHCRFLPGSCVLTADVGGTNTTFGFLREEQGHIVLLLSLYLPSKEINNFSIIVKEAIEYAQEYQQLQTTAICIAGAGPVSNDGEKIMITHLPWKISALDIKKKCRLPTLLINDFDAIAYSLEVINKREIINVKKGTAVPQKPRVVLGAGTGLGKSVLIYNREKKHYQPLASEGGHASASLETKQEFELARFIQEKEQSSVIAWEDVLSGRGLQNIYQYLEKVDGKIKSPIQQKIQQARYNPAMISYYHDQDSRCNATFDLFLRLYARCAKNLALDALAIGGVYLAGGIISKHIHLLQQKVFKDEFIHNKKMNNLLKKIPVYAIQNYHCGLYGAAQALRLLQRGEFP